MIHVKDIRVFSYL